jgi:hypothetical protein
VASVRREIRIRRPAAEVWAVAGDPARLHEWFPGITACTVEGDTRTITLNTGIQLPERIVTHDDVLRRFQYRITAPLFTEHQGTIDVHDLGDGTSLVVYSTDAEPRTMALVVGGGTGGALESLRRRFEGDAD